MIHEISQACTRVPRVALRVCGCVVHVSSGQGSRDMYIWPYMVYDIHVAHDSWYNNNQQ